MKPSLTLFELISTLEPDEIATIRRGAQVHVKGGENKYLALFDEVIAQQEYDEKQIVKKLGYEQDLNKFAFFKNYLYNYILKCLEQRKGFVKKEIRSGITRIQILIDKKLFSLAAEEISKAEEVCRKYQVLHLWIVLNGLKLDILKVRKKNGEDVLSELSEIKRELGKLIKARRTLIFYRKLFSLVRKKHHYTSFINELGEHDEFRKVMQSELMESDTSLNFFHKNYFLFAKGIYYYAEGDYQKATIIANEMLKLWEANKEMNKIFFGAFYNTYYNKALNEMKRDDFRSAIDTCKNLFTELDRLNKGNTFDRYMLYNLMVNIYNTCGYYDKGVEMATEYKLAREKLKKNIHRAQAEQLYHSNLAAAYFGVGDFKSANKHINEIINNEIDYTNDVTCLAYFLSLIIHFEMGNTELLTYRIKSVQRYLTKKGCLLNIKLLTIDFLKQLPKLKSHAGLKTEFRELKRKTEETLDKFPIEKKLLEMFDVLSWLDSKIEGVPFIEICKRKRSYALD